MRFKAEATLFIDKIIMLCLFFAVLMALLIYSVMTGNTSEPGFYFLGFCAVVSIILTLLDIFGKHDEIVIDENGISCVKGSKVQWKYGWSEIERLCKITVYGNPGVSVVLTEETENKIAPQDRKPISFQLCPTAKKALKLYSPYPLLKKW